MPATTTRPVVELGYAPIDSEHQAFAALVAKLTASDDVAFPSLLAELLAHTEHHFEHENALMEQYDFPALPEHRGEHTRVLGELRQFKDRADRGLIPFARAFVAERLLPWFEQHLLTMDSALTAHLKSHRSS